MSKLSAKTLFALVESFFTGYLPHQRGASQHTIRAYRDTLNFLFMFAAGRRSCTIANLGLNDFDAELVAKFLDHLEAGRSNSTVTRNCRRAAIRSFFKHLLRNDTGPVAPVHAGSRPAFKKRPPRSSSTYLEAADVRAIIASPDRRTPGGWRDMH